MPTTTTAQFDADTSLAVWLGELDMDTRVAVVAALYDRASKEFDAFTFYCRQDDREGAEYHRRRAAALRDMASYVDSTIPRAPEGADWREGADRNGPFVNGRERGSRRVG